MKKIVIETNGILRLLLNDIPNQADEVEELIKKAKKEQVTLLIPQIVLFEIDFALEKLYRVRKQEVIGKLKSILASPYFTIESKDQFGEALVLYERHSFVSLVDCFLIAYTKLEKAELFTFDQQLRKLRIV